MYGALWTLVQERIEVYTEGVKYNYVNYFF